MKKKFFKVNDSLYVNTEIITSVEAQPGVGGIMPTNPKITVGFVGGTSRTLSEADGRKLLAHLKEDISE